MTKLLLEKIAENNLYKALVTKFRSLEIEGEELQSVYRKLGTVFGVFLSDSFVGKELNIKTPTDSNYSGIKLNSENTLFVSTFEDNKLFAREIGSFYENASFAKLDVNDRHKGWKAEVVKVDLPEIKCVDTVVFCKSVLATGCTAKTILNKIVQHYKPSNIIIVSILGSNEAIKELQTEYPYLPIKFLVGELDLLDEETGLLMPGVGNIEDRLKKIS